MHLPLSSSKNAIAIEHVFADVAVVFPKLSINPRWRQPIALSENISRIKQDVKSL